MENKESMLSLQTKLAAIQAELKAPKSQFNKFGKYNYRSCEDILEGVKPLLNGAIITLGDEIQLIGDRYYVKATASIIEGECSISTSSYAREDLALPGMYGSQVTGTASSYARKYALNGLLLIDDTKDDDHNSTLTKDKPIQVQQSATPGNRIPVTHYDRTKLASGDYLEINGEGWIVKDFVSKKTNKTYRVLESTTKKLENGYAVSYYMTSPEGKILLDRWVLDTTSVNPDDIPL